MSERMTRKLPDTDCCLRGLVRNGVGQTGTHTHKDGDRVGGFLRTPGKDETVPGSLEILTLVRVVPKTPVPDVR